jgi:hypothetical protein
MFSRSYTGILKDFKKRVAAIDAFLAEATE